jgi:hypothetical protein
MNKLRAALALTGAALFGAGVAHADQESSTDAPVDIGASCPHGDLNEIVPDTDGGLARSCIPPPQLHALDAIHGAAAQRAERSLPPKGDARFFDSRAPRSTVNRQPSIDRCGYVTSFDGVQLAGPRGSTTGASPRRARQKAIG